MNTLQQLRAGLHVSASAIKTYLTCPKKFEFHYVLGAEPEFRPSALILGKAVHDALAVHHRAIAAGKDASPSEIHDRLREAMEAETALPVPIQFKNGESLDGLVKSGQALVDVYLREANLQHVVAVEAPFQFELVDPRTGAVAEPRLIGVFDLIEADQEGTVSVVEIKTASRRWSASQVDLDLQGSLYSEAIAQAGFVPEGQEALIRYDILVKNKTPVLDRQYAVRRPGDRELARIIAIDALHAIERGSFYRNPSWACDGCPFKRQCGV